MMEEFAAKPRDDADKIAVIITDGKSTIDEENTITSAEAARNEGIKIFSIGVGNDTDETELKEMSSLPQEKDQNYFSSPKFQTLQDIRAVVTYQICPASGKSIKIQ